MKDGAAHALLRGLVDFAGLFPPAELSLPTAFAAYQSYRCGGDAWMLGKFICPEGKLPELLDLLARDEDTGGVVSATNPRAVVNAGGGEGRLASFEISALPAIDWNDANGVTRSFSGLAGVRERSQGRASVTAAEIKLPDALPLDVAVSRVADALPVLSGAAVFLEPAPSIAAIDNLVQGLARRALAATLRDERVDGETSLRSAGKASAAASSAAFKGTSGSVPSTLGLKLRCGGTASAAFPEPSIVAHALTACRDNVIPFKATAGLHHPLRHRRTERQLDVWMHGFINVFGAAVLAHAEGLDESTVRAVVEDTDPASFSWDGDAFAWRGRRVTVPQIEELRAGLVVSFGSCSFDEPREDLRALGWLR